MASVEDARQKTFRARLVLGQGLAQPGPARKRWVWFLSELTSLPTVSRFFYAGASEPIWLAFIGKANLAGSKRPVSTKDQETTRLKDIRASMKDVRTGLIRRLHTMCGEDGENPRAELGFRRSQTLRLRQCRSDGLIPLFVTAERFGGEVVLVVLEYHYWWRGRYGAILERLTNYKIIDFRYDRRVHCFSEVIVGLRIHGELVVDPKLMPNGLIESLVMCVCGSVESSVGAREGRVTDVRSTKLELGGTMRDILERKEGRAAPERLRAPSCFLYSRMDLMESDWLGPCLELEAGKSIKDFQALLHQGYSGKPSATSSAPLPLPLATPSRPCVDHAKAAKPKMLIFIRKQNRVILNLPHVVTACRRAGFAPHVMNLRRQTPLPVIHAALASADAMVAVHGAAVTHFLFMRPGTVLLQIVPVGLDWAAESFYGKPAQQLGLEYLEYRVAPEESSLAAEYGLNSTVVQDPSVISSQGWWEMKKVYMDRQNVTVSIKRFGELLRAAKLHLKKNATACGGKPAAASHAAVR
uniref:Glycosyltransferase 61 catalytic domain-containing protein n=1 Tax=Aegilops tauschii TaxID=37682 RepID=M8CWR5_AEGTA